MRVLIVCTRFFHGDGEFSYSNNLAGLLRANGHEVSFFSMQDERNLPDPNDDLFVSHINFRAINEQKNLQNGFRVAGRIFYSAEARKKFAQLVERVQPDVVHLQNIHSHITPSVIFEAQKRSLPLVWTLHDYRVVCPNSHFYMDKSGEICEACRGGKFWKAPLKRCKKDSRMASLMTALEAYFYRLMRVREYIHTFVTPSAFLRQKLLESGYAAETVRHIPLFLPAELFAPSTADASYLLFIGRLEPHKGVRALVEAARRVPEVKIIIAGRLGVPLEEMTSLPLPANVDYVGFKSGAELDELRRNARAFIVPSTWYENQPFSILEAFATGKPVIATGIGGMRELVGENERGRIFPLGDVDALADAMRWMNENPQGAAELGQRAYDYCREEHSPQEHYEQVMQIYKKSKSV